MTILLSIIASLGVLLFWVGTIVPGLKNRNRY